jgi:hypothetical protein
MSKSGVFLTECATGHGVADLVRAESQELIYEMMRTLMITNNREDDG